MTDTMSEENRALIAVARDMAAVLRAADDQQAAQGVPLGVGPGSELRDALRSAAAVLDRVGALPVRIPTREEVAEIIGAVAANGSLGGWAADRLLSLMQQGVVNV